MKEKRNILIAFILNLSFSIFELVGGIFTGSVAILSDSLHDIGDAMGIGVSYLLEKKSQRPPDNTYTYGYARYSVLGSLFTTLILLFGSILVVYSAILRLITPTPINYKGMFLFAVVGIIVNFIAVLFTKDGKSLNQKAVNLHMLEDVLGWLVVLIGAIVMYFTNFAIIDPILSIVIALFIFLHAIKHFIKTCQIFLEKTPNDISIKEISQRVSCIENVIDVHHVHVWSLDGQNHCATLHVVVIDENAHDIKHRVRAVLQKFNISHVTIEIEKTNEHCHEKECIICTNHFGHQHRH